MHTLLFLEPGHFHAALLLKSANARIAPDVHVYAAPGPERDAFLALLDSFNARDQAPTRWRPRVHEAAHADAALKALVAERRGDAVVLAGRNGGKLAAVARLHREGFAVLADKPWIVSGAAVPDLDAACRGAPLAMDIMPDRHELLARLRRRVTVTPELFGKLAADDPQGPAIELGSTHHLLKVVNGRPLRRPTWYYDPHVQGDGMVDVQSHLADQAQWLVDADRAWDPERDVVIEAARRWATPVPPALYRESTGEDAYPPGSAAHVRGGVLHYPCNGEIRARLAGVSVRLVADWGQREPQGGCDLHAAVVRGTRAVLEVRHGADTGFVPRVLLTPRPGVRLDGAIAQALAAWQDEFPGLTAERAGEAFRFTAPAALHTTHESHFARALEGFLDCLDAGEWPADLQPRIRTRYRMLAAARDLALASGSGGQDAP